MLLHLHEYNPIESLSVVTIVRLLALVVEKTQDCNGVILVIEG